MLAKNITKRNGLNHLFSINLLEGTTTTTVHVVLPFIEWSFAVQESYDVTIGNQLLFVLEFKEFWLGVWCESPLLRLNDKLLSWELEFASTERFDDLRLVLWSCSARDEDLSDLDTSSQTLWFTVGTSHTGLKSISSGARKHLVDTEYVVWVDTDTHVEIFLTNGSGQEFVGANSRGFESFTGELFQLIGYQVDAQWEFHHTGCLETKIVDTDLWVWHTTVEPGFWVRFVFTVPVTSCWSSPQQVLPVLQEQAISEVSLLPWCARPKDPHL